jgi:two-component system cell cycle response regulator
LRQAIETDSLTDILNRRGFERAFARLIADRGRVDGQIFLGLIDIDRFKSVNDTWGHAAGDRVLKTFSERLRDAIGGFDAAAGRVGGEEFAVCLWASAEMDPQAIFRSLQGAVTADAFPLGNGLAIALTCSIGFASLSRDTGPEDCFRRADAALYQAKRFGRNLVRLGEAA